MASLPVLGRSKLHSLPSGLSLSFLSDRVVFQHGKYQNGEALSFIYIWMSKIWSRCYLFLMPLVLWLPSPPSPIPLSYHKALWLGERKEPASPLPWNKRKHYFAERREAGCMGCSWGPCLLLAVAGGRPNLHPCSQVVNGINDLFADA